MPDEVYLPTWNQLRTDSSFSSAFAERYPDATARANETSAAQKAAAHADTPSTAHFDALGRPFLTVARNRVVCADHPLNGKPDEEFRTRVELDIEGNQRRVFDERKLPDAANLPLEALEQRVVMQYAYDMLGNRIHQFSMEAGARWMLNDVAGKPIRAWDSRGHDFTTTYDALRRPIEQYVQGTFSDPDPLKPNSDPRTLNPPDEAGLLVDKIEYGEPPLNATPAQETEAQRLNLRTRIYRHFDSAGVATNARLDAAGNPLEAYDFKGNVLRSTRQLVSYYKDIPDWSQNPTLDAETFEGSTRYDALNRPIQSIAPHSSLPGAKRNVIQLVFNAANLLERVDVWLGRASDPDALLDPNAEAPSAVGVANIDYDAKGQRLRIDYKNSASTFYSYDPLTFRLTQLITQRNAAAFPKDDPQPPIAGWPGRQVQSLHYTYDPAGNITSIRDDAQQTIYFKNKRVEPSAGYTYDAVYRLIEASGREHLGQASGALKAPTPHSYNDVPRVGILHPSDGNAMGRYLEHYVYDAVGNFQEMIHRGTDPADPGWTRSYAYNEPSQLEHGKQSNRLTSTTVGTTTETYSTDGDGYDAHGNMQRMPQLQIMLWDFNDQLQMTQRQAVNADDEEGVQHQGERTWYVYDAGGQRVRKVTERQAAAGTTPTRMKERIYLGGFEIYREYENDGDTVHLERETLHIMDDQQRIALIETRTQGDDGSPVQLIRYQFGNHLGSASLELDHQAQIISYEEYTPYGSTSYQAVRSQTETPKRYRYAGMERDEESGLNYHTARYYAPWLCRWTAVDPISIKDDINLYAYIKGSPLIYTDRTGLDSKEDESFKEDAARANKFKDIVKEAVKDYVDPSIGLTESDVLAIIMVESSGNPDKGKTGTKSESSYKGLLQLQQKDDYDDSSTKSARETGFNKGGDDPKFKWSEESILKPELNIRYGTFIINLRVQQARESIGRKERLVSKKLKLEDDLKKTEDRAKWLKDPKRTAPEKKEFRTEREDIGARIKDIKNDIKEKEKSIEKEVNIEQGNKLIEKFLKTEPALAAYLLHQQGLKGLRNILEAPTKAINSKMRMNITDESAKKAVRTNEQFVKFWRERLSKARTLVAP